MSTLSVSCALEYFIKCLLMPDLVRYKINLFVFLNF